MVDGMLGSGDSVQELVGLLYLVLGLSGMRLIQAGYLKETGSG